MCVVWIFLCTCQVRPWRSVDIYMPMRAGWRMRIIWSPDAVAIYAVAMPADAYLYTRASMYVCLYLCKYVCICVCISVAYSVTHPRLHTCVRVLLPCETVLLRYGGYVRCGCWRDRTDACMCAFHTTPC